MSTRVGRSASLMSATDFCAVICKIAPATIAISKMRKPDLRFSLNCNGAAHTGL
jgi:hypothetical protein